jgi:hypothetical protein
MHKGLKCQVETGLQCYVRTLDPGPWYLEVSPFKSWGYPKVIYPLDIHDTRLYLHSHWVRNFATALILCTENIDPYQTSFVSNPLAKWWGDGCRWHIQQGLYKSQKTLTRGQVGQCKRCGTGWFGAAVSFQIQIFLLQWEIPCNCAFQVEIIYKQRIFYWHVWLPEGREFHLRTGSREIARKPKRNGMERTHGFPIKMSWTTAPVPNVLKILIPELVEGDFLGNHHVSLQTSWFPVKMFLI